jgi:hypothetical protein
MSCYAMIIKNKSHKEVIAIVDKVISNKMTNKAAAKELGLSDHAFEELYIDITSKLLVV